MSRLDELKKQYPELNVSFMDMLVRMDISKTYKYLPVLCKIFSTKFRELYNYIPSRLDEINKDYFIWSERTGIKPDDLSLKELYSLRMLSDHWSEDTFKTMVDFMRLMDKNLMENKDVTSYSSIDEIREALSLASLKEFTKQLENEVHKEYEDSEWVMIRPLTFLSSSKYGANTKWCTTYSREKQYFEKYWRRGILVYFINKKTGYKFAGFKSLDYDKEFHFWNAEDNRVDFLDLDLDEKLYKIIKEIFKSDKTNKELSSDEIQEQVHLECLNQNRLEPISIQSFPTGTLTVTGSNNLYFTDESHTLDGLIRLNFDTTSEQEPTPTMTA